MCWSSNLLHLVAIRLFLRVSSMFFSSSWLRPASCSVPMLTVRSFVDCFSSPPIHLYPDITCWATLGPEWLCEAAFVENKIPLTEL